MDPENDGAIWTMTGAEFREELAKAWEWGANAGWESSGEGWNAEYPGHPFSANEATNPYRKASE